MKVRRHGDGASLVGRVDELGFAPLDDTGAQLQFRFVASAHEHRSLGIGPR